MFLSNGLSATALAAYMLIWILEMPVPYMGRAVEGDAKDGVTGGGVGWNKRGNRGKTKNV